jgi:predicted nucleotidyltransferase
MKNQPFVNAIYLYGSRARGDADSYSDYDLAIDCPTASDEEWNTLVQQMEEAPFLSHLEVVRYDQLPSSVFKQQIDKYKQVLYAKT